MGSSMDNFLSKKKKSVTSEHVETDNDLDICEKLGDEEMIKIITGEPDNITDLEDVFGSDGQTPNFLKCPNKN